MKKLVSELLTIALVLTLSFPLLAQQDTAAVVNRPKVGLALSGGAAHGLAHIGVLRFLEEINFPIDYITGTSMGSIIGGLKAMGYTSEQIYDIQKTMNWDAILENRIFLNQISPAEKYYHNKFILEADITKNGLQFPFGIVQSNNLDLVLSRLYLPSYKTNNFGDLPIPFQCYSVDVVSGKVECMNQGDLSLAIRSSMAIPPLFPPVFQGDKILVDGGLIKNFPVEDVEAMGADIVVGSYVGARFEKTNEITSLLDIVKQSSFMMGIMESNRQAKMTDILITPDVKDHSSFDFGRSEEYIEEGYEAAKAKKEHFLQIQDSLGLYANQDPWRSPLTIEDSIYISELLIPDVSRRIRTLVEDKLELQNGNKYILKDIEDGIRRAYATKIFKTLRYRLIPDLDGGNTLMIHAIPIKNISVGLTINRFESSGVGAIVGFTARNFLTDLLQARLYGRLSQYPAAYAEITRRGGIGTRNFVYGIKAKFENLKQPLFTDDLTRLSFESLELDIDAGLTWEYSTALSFSLYYNMNNRFLRNEFNRPPGLYRNSHEMGRFDGSITFSTLNRRELPSKGWEASVNAQYITHLNTSKTLFNEEDKLLENLGEGYSGGAYFRHAFPVTHNINFTYRLAGQFTTHDIPTLAMLFGSPMQDHDTRLPFVGLLEGRLQLTDYLYGRGAIKYELSKRFSLAAIANYAIGYRPILLETPAQRTTDNELGLGLGLHVAFPWGPLQLEVGRTLDDPDFVASFSFGYRMFK